MFIGECGVGEGGGGGWVGQTVRLSLRGLERLEGIRLGGGWVGGWWKCSGGERQDCGGGALLLLYHQVLDGARQVPRLWSTPMHQVQINWVLILGVKIQLNKKMGKHLVVAELLWRIVGVDHRGLAEGGVEVEDLVVVVVTLVDQGDDGKVLGVRSRYGFPAWEGGEACLLSDGGGLLLEGVAGVDHLHLLHRVGEQGDDCAGGGRWQCWGGGGGFEAGEV